MPGAIQAIVESRNLCQRQSAPDELGNLDHNKNNNNDKSSNVCIRDCSKVLVDNDIVVAPPPSPAPDARSARRVRFAARRTRRRFMAKTACSEDGCNSGECCSPSLIESDSDDEDGMYDEDQYTLNVQEIDAHWLQRKLSEYYDGTRTCVRVWWIRVWTRMRG